MSIMNAVEKFIGTCLFSKNNLIDLLISSQFYLRIKQTLCRLCKYLLDSLKIYIVYLKYCCKYLFLSYSKIN